MLEVSDGGLYKLGCRAGVLDSHYSRNQFAPTLEFFLKSEDVPLDITVSLRTAVGAESSLSVHVWGSAHIGGASVLKTIESATPGATIGGVAKI